MKSKLFQRKIENFICEHCQFAVTGNGYTDHCPQCLYSKHVDINPGDRQCDCHGLLKPTAVEYKKDKYLIYYQCEKCNHLHRVKSSSEDNIDTLLKYINKPINYKKI